MHVCVRTDLRALQDDRCAGAGQPVRLIAIHELPPRARGQRDLFHLRTGELRRGVLPPPRQSAAPGHPVDGGDVDGEDRSRFVAGDAIGHRRHLAVSGRSRGQPDDRDGDTELRAGRRLRPLGVDVQGVAIDQASAPGYGQWRPNACKLGEGRHRCLPYTPPTPSLTSSARVSGERSPTSRGGCLESTGNPR